MHLAMWRVIRIPTATACPTGQPRISPTRSAAAATVCRAAPSGAFLNLATCGNQTWLQHLAQGRIAEKVWEFISEDQNGTTCGW